MKFKVLILLSLLALAPYATAEKTTLRLGVLAFGTVNWELKTIKNLNLLQDQDFQLQIHPLANPQAGKIALQSGAVDIIVSDWIWVSRLRATGSDYTFYPYSTTSGALLVAADSQINSIADLRGKQLGIAGGELDKNWLLLQALAAQKKITDFDANIVKVYGAPPLLNQQFSKNRVDAIINYWHYAAKLEAKGFKQLLNGQEMLQNLGINLPVPTLGYVFNRDWGLQHKQMINQFLNTTQQAKDRLCHSDTAWLQIVPLTKAKDLATQTLLRERYCAGRIKQWGVAEHQAAAKIYQLLRKISHNKLTGESEVLQKGTFWDIE